jgi:hypothetical protein
LTALQPRGWATAAGIAAIAGVSSITAQAPTEFPAGPGQAVVHAACAPCHAITVVTGARKSEAEWASTVDAMITRGAPVPDADYDVIVEYLVRNFSAP